MYVLIYLKDGEFVGVPLVDPGLAEVHHCDGDLGAVLGHDGARWAAHVPGADTAHSAYLRHGWGRGDSGGYWHGDSLATGRAGNRLWW